MKDKGWCPCGRWITLTPTGMLYRHLDYGTDDWCENKVPAVPPNPQQLTLQPRPLRVIPQVLVKDGMLLFRTGIVGIGIPVQDAEELIAAIRRAVDGSTGGTVRT